MKNLLRIENDMLLFQDVYGCIFNHLVDVVFLHIYQLQLFEKVLIFQGFFHK